MSTLMSGARMLAECLAREGVDCMFGYPGGVTLPFYDVLYDHQIRHVLVRHEENAAFAAGQVTSKLIGSDAFQEADTFGITRPCTKHNYLVKKLDELAQIIHEAFYIASTGRPGPVLVDVTKDVLQAQGHYTPVTSIHLPGYKVFTEGPSSMPAAASSPPTPPPNSASSSRSPTPPRSIP